MNSATIENKTHQDFNDISNDNDDVLSLRDLQMSDNTDVNSTITSPRASSAQELFEFFHNLTSNPIGTEEIVFCGKVFSGSVDDGLNDHYLTLVESSSLPESPLKHLNPTRSVKFSTPVKKMNMTALTSMSSKSRRRMFMFGPVKFLPEMEMSAIRKRQGRRAPSQMFPVAEGGDATATGKVVAGRQKNQRGTVVKTLSCRAGLNAVFERSFACLRP